MIDSGVFSYPRLIRRVQALLIDGFLLSVCMLGSMALASKSDISGVSAVVATAIIAFSLEPLLVSTTGGTIGHHLRGLTVLHTRTRKRLNVLSATVRFALKILLGWLSLLTYFTTKRYQAIHDLISKSVVVLKSPNDEGAFQKLGEREFQASGFRYPSTLRQIVMVVLYNILFVVITSFCVGLLSGLVCSYMTAYCVVFSVVISIIWQIAVIIFIGISIYYCRLGRVWGCKRQSVLKENT